MRVVQLHAENVKRLIAVDIKPQGDKNVVIIGGDNAQGKSSTLDCLAYAIGGKALIPEKPIRRGADKGMVEVDLGELKVIRTFTEKGSELKVFAKDGSKVAGPQTILDTLYSTMTFDPLDFANKPPKEQAAILRKLVALDLSDLDAKEKRLFDTRSTVNAEVKRLSGVFSAKKFHTDAPKEAVSVADLTEQLNAETEKSNRYGEVERQIQSWRRESTRYGEEIARLRALLAEAELEKAKADEAIAGAEGTLSRMEPGNTTAILAQISEADAINQKVRDNAEYAAAREELDEKEVEASGLTANIEKVRAEKERMVKEANFPVAGLGFDGEGVTFNGLPFDQASGAERLRVSVAIGAALNPKLKVLIVRDGSLLDDKSMQLLADLAEEHDCQIWIERVGDKDECAVVIQDGMVRE